MSLVQFTTQRTYPSSLLHIILKDFLPKKVVRFVPENSNNTIVLHARHMRSIKPFLGRVKAFSLQTEKI